MPEGFNINEYSLGVELALNTGQAFQALDEFYDRAQKLEKQLTDSLNKAMQSVATTVSGVSAHIDDMVKQFAKIVAHTDSIAPQIQDIGDVTGQQVADLEKIAANWPEEKKQLEMRQDVAEQVTKAQQQELGFFKKAIGFVGNIIKKLHTKNQEHERENDLVQQEETHLGGVGNSVDRINHRLKDTHHGLTGIGDRLMGLLVTWKLVSDQVEHFHTVNFRLLGTQQELVEQADVLTHKYNLLRKEGLEAYEALGNLKVPKTQIAEYAKLVAMTHRITGVSIDTLSQYVAHLRAVGYGSREATVQLSWMANAMRKLGLNSKEINSVLADTTVTAYHLSKVFFDDKDAKLKWDRLMVMNLKLSTELYGTAEAGEKLNDSLRRMTQNDVAMAKLDELLGRPIKTVDDFEDAVGKLGESIAREVGSAAAAGRDYNTVLETMAKVYDLSGQEVAELLINQEGLIKKLWGTRDGFKAVIATMQAHEQASKDLADYYKSSTDLVVQQWERLKSAFYVIWTPLQSFVAAFLEPIIGWLATVAGWLGKAVQKLAELFRYWEKLGGASQQIAVISKFLIGMVLTLGVVGMAFRGFGNIITWFGGLFGRIFGGAAGGAPGLFASFGTAVTGVARGIGSAVVWLAGQIRSLVMGIIDILVYAAEGARSIVISLSEGLSTAFVNLSSALGRGIHSLLTMLGRGLSNLGRSVAPVIVPLLALGAAFILVSAGAWIFAQAIAVVARYGTQGALAVLVLSVSVGVLLAVMVALGTVATAASIGLLALGAAFIMVGAGAWLFAKAVETVAALGSSGLVTLAAFTVAIVALGGALVGLGFLANFAVPGLLALGAAMLMIGGGAWLLAKALGVVASTFLMIVDAIGPHSPPLHEKFALIADATGGLTRVLGSLIPVGKLLAKVFSGVAAVLSWAYHGITGFFRAAGSALASAYDAAVAAVVGFFGAIWQAGKDLLGAGGRMVSELWAGAGSVLKNVGGWLYDGGLWLVQKLGEGIAIGAGLLRDAFLFLPNLAASALSATWNMLVDAKDWIGQKFYDIGSWAASSFWSGIEMIKQGFSWFTGLVTGTWDWAAGKVSGTLSAIGSGLKSFGSWVADTASTAYEGVKSGLSAATDWVGTKARQLGAAVTGGLSTIGSAVSSLGSSLKGMMGTGLDVIKDTITGVLSKANTAWLDDMLGKTEQLGKVAGSMVRSMGGLGQVAVLLAPLMVALGGFPAATTAFIAALSEAAAGIGGSGLAAAVEQQAVAMERSLDRLTGAMGKYTGISDALNKQAEATALNRLLVAPRMPAEEGSREAARAETIATVQVKPYEEAESEAVPPEVTLLREQNELLKQIVASLGSSEVATQLTELTQILRENAANLTGGSIQDDLPGQYTDWTG